MSMDARDLLRRMLTTDPEARITIPEIWEHPWVKNGPAYERRADGGLYNIGRDLATGAVHVRILPPPTHVCSCPSAPLPSSLALPLPS